MEFIKDLPKEFKGTLWAAVFIMVIPLLITEDYSFIFTILTYQAAIVYLNHKLDNTFYKGFKSLWRKIKKHL